MHLVHILPARKMSTRLPERDFELVRWTWHARFEGATAQLQAYAEGPWRALHSPTRTTWSLFR